MFLLLVSLHEDDNEWSPNPQSMNFQTDTIYSLIQPARW